MNWNLCFDKYVTVKRATNLKTQICIFVFALCKAKIMKSDLRQPSRRRAKHSLAKIKK